VPLALLGAAWWTVARGETLARLPVFVWARAVRDAAGELLPFSPVGGVVAGARAACERGVPPVRAFATSVADITTELIAQIGFTCLGLALLVARLGGGGGHEGLARALTAGLVPAAGAAAALILLQRRGAGLAVRLTERFLPAAAARTAEIADALGEIWRRPARYGAAVVLHLGAWAASATGVWLALAVSGAGLPLGSILAIEALVAAARSVGFAAPLGLGVQEASYALVGPLFGLSPEMALAISLLRRGRDVVIGLPVLLGWQGLEGLRLMTRSAEP